MDYLVPLNSLQALSSSRVQGQQSVSSAKQTSEVQTFQKLLATSDHADVSKPAETAAREKAAKEFEVMVLSQMIGEIFNQQPEGAFGQGMQGDFYSSIFSEAVAEKLAEGEGVGIAKLL